MNPAGERRFCEEFQNGLNYDKIDKIWRNFRETGNSSEGRINRSMFKKVLTRFGVKNDRFIDKLFERFRLDDRFQEHRADKAPEKEEIDVQDFAIGLVLISLIPFLEKVRYIFYLTDLDEDGCLSLQEIENMIERIEKIFCKENSSAKVDSFSLLLDIAHRKAQRNYKEIVFLLFKNNPGLKTDEGGLITCEEFIEALGESHDLYKEEKFIPLNISLAEMIENCPQELEIKITEDSRTQFCQFRKELYMILQKPDQKDVIKYPCRVEIYRGDKKLETLPSTEKIVEKEKKSEKVGKEKRVQKGEFREGEQKKAEQALAEYKLKVKKMIETKQDPRLNIQFDRMVRK